MNQIRHYRELSKLSRHELGEAIGRVESTIGHYETGRRFPDLETSRNIVGIFNKAGVDCSLDDVFPVKQESAA